MVQDTLAIILAGGEGKRLQPLTLERAKPAVPFAGKYRLIDIVLSNLVNSGIHNVSVITQYNSTSLQEHLKAGWDRRLGGIGQNLKVLQANLGAGRDWYRGTADAITQNLLHYTTNGSRTDAQAWMVFAADHVYKMDANAFREFHLQKDADLTIAAIRKPRAVASSFGVLGVDSDNMVGRFDEKPADPPAIPGSPDESLVSMGNYAFKREALLEALKRDAAKESTTDRDLTVANPDRYTSNDFGHDVIPDMLRRGCRIAAYPYGTLHPKMEPQEASYWEDVGTIDAYFAANMDCRAPKPVFNLYNKDWPIRARPDSKPPPKFVHPRTRVENCLVCDGSIVSEAQITDSILGLEVRVRDGAHVERSLLFEGTDIGAGSELRNCIIDKGVAIPPKTRIGYSREDDLARGFTISDGGIVVVPKGYKFPSQ